MATTQAGAEDRIALRIPATASTSAVDLGTHRVTSDALDSASAHGEATTVTVPGGLALLRPTAGEFGTIAVVEVFVPDGDLTRGVATAWLILAGVGVGLIVTSWPSRTGSAAGWSVPPYDSRAPRTSWARATSGTGAGGRAARTAGRRGGVQRDGRPGGGAPRGRT